MTTAGRNAPPLHVPKFPFADNAPPQPWFPFCALFAFYGPATPDAQERIPTAPGLSLTSHLSLSPLTSRPLTLSPSHLTRTLYEILVARQLF
jgi:hypothetical protein